MQCTEHHLPADMSSPWSLRSWHSSRQRSGAGDRGRSTQMQLLTLIIFAFVGGIALGGEMKASERVTIPRTLEHTVAFYEAGSTGPEHSRFRYPDGLWIDITPLKDSTVLNFFGAYPSLSLFSDRVHKLLKSGASPTNENTPLLPGNNSSRYLFGQVASHSIAGFKGLSYMAQYTQGPGDHSLKNRDLYWTLQGLIYSSDGERLFVVRAGMAVSHESLRTKRPYKDGSTERSKGENRALRALDTKGFTPSIEGAVKRLSEVIKLVEQDAPSENE